MLELTRRTLLRDGSVALGGAILAGLGLSGQAQPAAAQSISSDSAALSFRARLRPASFMRLHDDTVEWADSNSPFLRTDGNSLAFVSSFQPMGHAYRRKGGRDIRSLGPMEAVQLRDDPMPGNGKWIEAVWSAGNNRLYGWYHAETKIPGNEALVSPSIGAIVSEDQGASWRLLGPTFDFSSPESDEEFSNGFVAGGSGDFCVVVNPRDQHVYLYASTYGPQEDRQGIIAARYPVASLEQPHSALEVWVGSDGWCRKIAGDGLLPTPFWQPERSWRYSDPIAFWGPAIHFNRYLGVYVMLINRTASGNRDWRQEGIFVSFNPSIEDPDGWSPPQRIVEGGLWYPQVVGAGPSDGDTLAGGIARFFLAGFSAWEIVFSTVAEDAPWADAIAIDRQTVAAAMASAVDDSPRRSRRGRSQTPGTGLRPRRPPTPIDQ